MKVEYAPCKKVLVPGPVCILPTDRKIYLWVDAPPEARIEIQVEGRQAAAAMEPIQAGQRLSLPAIPLGAKRLDVLVATGEGQASWSLSLVKPEGIRPGTFVDLRGASKQKMNHVQNDIDNRRLAAARETL
ncbi:MAG TPA: hypothetical protein VE078_09535, partial [Thermoanaerobaculia bacterium]|nr:hypothetical protein [Thermoanaerobaculia bacterium]